MPASHLWTVLCETPICLANTSWDHPLLTRHCRILSASTDIPYAITCAITFVKTFMITYAITPVVTYGVYGNSVDWMLRIEYNFNNKRGG